MELLAPAGGPEQLACALHFGADAVYLAGTRWGMRAGARNFTDEELAGAVEEAHAACAAVHVTLNTIMYDDDIDALPAYLDLLEQIGVDAAIVADLGAIGLLRRYAPHVAIHLSTQASCTNAAAAEAYARLGVSRIVLAREMAIGQIAELRRRIPAGLELEAFAHGSMCMAYSGRCLLSAEMTGGRRSAGHGSCTQPCRWAWRIVEDRTPDRTLDLVQDGRGSYLLSSNDLNMIAHLDDLAAAGVDAIKLEGRAKGAYYVGTITNAYRHVLDGESADDWAPELDLVSHRPYSTGFYYGEPTQNPGREDYARNRILVAVVDACEPAGGSWRAAVTCRNRAEAGVVTDVLSPHKPVRQAHLSCPLVRNGEPYTLALPFPVAPGDLVCVKVGQ
ncbi:MAG: peptidase U32 family protein [Olegusella sp.]|nr:peptidase U32 family protein [Olegusella sp.]